MNATGTDVGDQPNEMGDSIVEINLGTGRSAVALMANGGTTCVITDLFDVKCWGFGWWPSHGHGNSINWGDSASELGDNLPITNLGTGRKAVQLSSGGSPCALLDNLTVKCWGTNGDGQLGLGNTASRGTGSSDMGNNLPNVDLGTVSYPILLVGGSVHNCALFANGAVKCWGDGAFSQTGAGNSSDYSNTSLEVGDAIPFVNLGTGRTAKALFSGPRAYSTCAILDDDTLKCWGDNTYGQLGLGDTNNRGDQVSEMGDGLSTVNIGTGLVPSYVSVGRNHTCVITTSGVLKCWGQNKYGQLGLGDYADRGDGAGEMGDSLPAISVGF